MIRSTLVIFLTIATIAACWLWKDSYRIREDRMEEIRKLPRGTYPDHKFPIGLIAWGQWDADRLYLRTFLGILTLADNPWPEPEPSFGKTRWGFFGFAYSQSRNGCEQVSIRFKTLVIVLGCYPALALTRALFRRLRRYRRHRSGFCLTCGYDLTGNISGLCPECATTVPTDSARLPSESAALHPQPART